MRIDTTRFGRITVEKERLLTLPRGLMGFPDQTRFALVPMPEQSCFFWLQSLEDPDLAFVVTDPNLFFGDYEVPVRDEVCQELELSESGVAQVLVICNRAGEWLTGNLLGPIVINAQTLMAQQVVLGERKWSTRQPLLRLVEEQRPQRRLARAA